MTKEPKAEWRGAPDFAEVAEALGVPTDHVMAVLGQFVLWSDGALGDDAPVYRSQVGRDADGILRSGPPEEVGRWGDMRKMIEKRMEDLP